MLKRSMVEVGYELLVKKQGPQKFNKFWGEVSEILGLEESEAEAYISDFYTNLSLDERFVLLEDNTWDLRERQSFDKVHIDMNDIYSEIEDEEKEMEIEKQEDSAYDDEASILEGEEDEPKNVDEDEEEEEDY